MGGLESTLDQSEKSHWVNYYTIKLSLKERCNSGASHIFSISTQPPQVISFFILLTSVLVLLYIYVQQLHVLIMKNELCANEWENCTGFGNFQWVCFTAKTRFSTLKIPMRGKGMYWFLTFMLRFYRVGRKKKFKKIFFHPRSAEKLGSVDDQKLKIN